MATRFLNRTKRVVNSCPPAATGVALSFPAGLQIGHAEERLPLQAFHWACILSRDGVCEPLL
jgi:hypothetical protein